MNGRRGVTGADLRVHFGDEGVPSCGAELGDRITAAPAAVTCSTCLASPFLVEPVGSR